MPESWGIHAYYQIDNQRLLRDGVLCPVNSKLDQSAEFNIPAPILKRVLEQEHIREPGPTAKPEELLDYAKRFNRDVMGHRDVVGVLAEKLAAHLRTLGKTIVFAPTIATADRLVAELDARLRTPGKVAVVHTRMGELPLRGRRPATPESVLAEFRGRKAEPAILVNVDMLTEGFDDPKIQTVVLARLTLSTNRFWQMIGRGLRGRKAGGTDYCNVIDPIKLVRLYGYFGGYQPSLTRDQPVVLDELDEAGETTLDPRVPVVSRPPPMSAVRPRVSDELRRTHARIAAALDAFLGGAPLSEEDAVLIARNVHVATAVDATVFEAAATPDVQTPGFVFREERDRAQARMQADLGWLAGRVPAELSLDGLRYWKRTLAAIEKLGLRTEDDYNRAEMDGTLAHERQIPVTGSPPASPRVAEPVPARTTHSPQGDAVATLCIAVGLADGALAATEVTVSARVVNRVSGEIDSDELRIRLAALRPAPNETAHAVAVLRELLDPAQRQSVVHGLVEVAFSDGVLHPAELALIRRVANGLGVSGEYVEALVQFLGPDG